MFECSNVEIVKTVIGAINVIIPIIVAILTFFFTLIGKWFLSAKEKKDISHTDANKSESLEDKLKNSYDGYQEKLGEICDKLRKKNTKITYADYTDFNKVGERYFIDLKNLCNSIMAKNLLHKEWLNDHSSKIDIRIVEIHYRVLNKLEDRLCINNKQKLNKKEYKNVYKVYYIFNSSSKLKNLWYKILHF